MCAFMKVFIPRSFVCAMLSIILPPYTEDVGHVASFQGCLLVSLPSSFTGYPAPRA